MCEIYNILKKSESPSLIISALPLKRTRTSNQQVNAKHSWK